MLLPAPLLPTTAVMVPRGRIKSSPRNTAEHTKVKGQREQASTQKVFDTQF